MGTRNVLRADAHSQYLHFGFVWVWFGLAITERCVCRVIIVHSFVRFARCDVMWCDALLIRIISGNGVRDNSIANGEESNRLCCVVAVFLAESDKSEIMKASFDTRICSKWGSPFCMAVRHCNGVTRLPRHRSAFCDWIRARRLVRLTFQRNNCYILFFKTWRGAAPVFVWRIFGYFQKTEQQCQRSTRAFPAWALSPEFFVCLRERERESCNKTTVVTVVLTWLNQRTATNKQANSQNNSTRHTQLHTQQTSIVTTNNIKQTHPTSSSWPVRNKPHVNRPEGKHPANN